MVAIDAKAIRSSRRRIERFPQHSPLEKREMFKPSCLLVLFFLAATAVKAEEVPRFNIKAICGEAPSLGQSAQATDKGCIQDETQARAQLEQQWPGFKASRRSACVQEASIGGPPSYVALLTCLQM
jgi:hypothetical protein